MQTVVDIVIKTVGTSSIDRLDRKLKVIPTQAKKAATSVDRVSKAVRGLGGAIASLGAADQLRRAFGAAADFSGTQQRVQNLTKTYSQFAGIQDIAAKSADRFAVSNSQALSDLTDLGSRLGSTGASLQDLQNIYEGFNTLLVNNAVNAQQAASAQLQLNQALGSGRLAGEEFNAINEATPQLLDEVAKVLGVNRGELKKLASEGKISSQVLIQALTNIKTKGADALADSLKTPAGQLRQFNKAISDFQVAVGTELLPVITPLIQGLTDLLKAFGDLPGPVRTAAVSIGLVATSVIALNSALGLLAGTSITGVIGGLATAFGALATKLALLGGGVQTAVTGFTVAGAAITKTTVAITAGTVALGAFKAVLGAGVLGVLIAVGAAIFNYNKKQSEFNRLVKEGKGTIDEYKTAIADKKKELEGARERLDELEGSSIRNARATQNQKDKVRELEAALKSLEGVYDVKIRIQTQVDQIAADVRQRAADAGGKSKGFDTLTDAEIQEALKLAGVIGNGDNEKKGGKGGGSAPATDDINALQRELKLLEDKLAIQQKIDAAQLAGDQELEIQLQGEQALLDLRKQGLDAIDEKNTADGKALQARINELQLAGQIAATNQQLAVNAKQRAEALQDALRPFEQQNELLRAQLQGKEKEVRINQQIAELKRQFPELDEAALRATLQQTDALTQQVAQLERQKQLLAGISQSVAGAIESSIGAAIESAVDGTKDLGEALQEIASGLLKDIGQQLIRYGISSLFGGIGLPGFASGGFVSGPTPALVGEGGESEYIIPASKMGDAMSRYNAGARGDSVIPGSGGGNGSQGGMGSSGTVVNYNGPTLSFNSEDYVPASAVAGIINEAAKQGAAQGQARTINTLKNSRSRRQKLGI